MVRPRAAANIPKGVMLKVRKIWLHHQKSRDTQAIDEVLRNPGFSGKEKRQRRTICNI